jgi:hypothetical protein
MIRQAHQPPTAHQPLTNKLAKLECSNQPSFKNLAGFIWDFI